MENLTVTKIYEVNARAFWSLISAADGLEKYLPDMIKSCSISSNQAGGKRVCTTHDGAVINETIHLNDVENMVFKYAVGNDNAVLPYQNYHGVVSITSLEDSRCKVSWSAEYEPKGMPANEVKTLIESLLIVLLDNMLAFA